ERCSERGTQREVLRESFPDGHSSGEPPYRRNVIFMISDESSIHQERGSRQQICVLPRDEDGYDFVSVLYLQEGGAIGSLAEDGGIGFMEKSKRADAYHTS